MKHVLASALLAVSGVAFAADPVPEKDDSDVAMETQGPRYFGCGPTSAYMIAAMQYGLDMPLVIKMSNGKKMALVTMKSKPGYFIFVEFETDKDYVCVVGEGQLEEE